MNAPLPPPRPPANRRRDAFDSARRRFLTALGIMLKEDDIGTEEKAEEVAGTISAIWQMAAVAGLDDA